MPSDRALHCGRSPSSTKPGCPLQPNQAVRRRCHGWRRIGYINPPRVVPDPANGCTCRSICSYHYEDWHNSQIGFVALREIARLVARHVKDEGANATAVDSPTYFTFTVGPCRAIPDVRNGGTGNLTPTTVISTSTPDRGWPRRVRESAFFYVRGFVHHDPRRSQ
jgi:hypothetical protein